MPFPRSYEVPLDPPSWTDAEAQIQRSLKSHSKHKDQVPTVSVKSSIPLGAKRKGETAEQVYNEEIGNREAKKLKQGMRKSKSGRD